MNEFLTSDDAIVTTKLNGTSRTHGCGYTDSERMSRFVLMIENAFQFGLVGEAGVNYHFKKNYAGFYFQVIDLQAANTPTASLIPSWRGIIRTTHLYRRSRWEFLAALAKQDGITGR